MSDTMLEEEKLEESIDLSDVDMDHPKKRSSSRSSSHRRKVYIYVLFASVLSALIGLNVKFILFLKSEKAKDQNVDIWRSLIISDDQNLYALEIGSKAPILLQTSNHGIAAFDVYSNETVLWNELQSSTIHPISKSYKSIEGTEIWRMQAIAIDHVNKLLYIIDKSLGTLSVFDVRKAVHGIVFSDLVKAHDLALDPVSGLMFILGQYDSILRCDMDGTFRRRIVLDPNITAFAIDREEKFVYYASNSLGIMVVDYEGQRRKQLVKVFTEILGLALFQNQLFWTSLSSNTSRSELWSCNLSTLFCDNTARLEIPLKNPKVIKAPSVLQTFDNPCEKNYCDQLCLLASNNSFSCACNMGWYLDPSTGYCIEVMWALTYVQGNYIRAKHPINIMDQFSDIIVPRSFYNETLKHKNSIDYTVGKVCFYISDDNAIYSINKTSLTIDGDQKKIFAVGKGFYIRNIDFDVMNEYLYYVIENSIGDQSISVLSLVTDEPTQKIKVKSQVDVFLIGAFYSLIYSPKWDEIFELSSSDVSCTENSIANDHFTSRLRYFDMYEMVGLDLISERLYWISNASVTKIEYVQVTDEFKIVSRGVIDLPIMIQPMYLAMSLDWIFIANSTGIWRFDKFDGHGAVQIAGYLGRDENQMVSHAKVSLFVAYNRFTDLQRLEKQEDMEMQIGV